MSDKNRAQNVVIFSNVHHKGGNRPRWGEIEPGCLVHIHFHGSPNEAQKWLGYSKLIDSILVGKVVSERKRHTIMLNPTDSSSIGVLAKSNALVVTNREASKHKEAITYLDPVEIEYRLKGL